MKERKRDLDKCKSYSDKKGKFTTTIDRNNL
jgi:hypothetical protein